MRAQSLGKHASQSVLSGQVQAPAPSSAFAPSRNAPYSLYQLPCTYPLKWRALKESRLDPLKHVMGDEDQPHKGVDGVEAAATQVAQPIHASSHLEEGFDALPSSIQVPQRHSIELGSRQIGQQYRVLHTALFGSDFTHDSSHVRPSLH